MATKWMRFTKAGGDTTLINLDTVSRATELNSPASRGKTRLTFAEKDDTVDVMESLAEIEAAIGAI